jgi:uncharacterized membrane protein
MKTRVVNLLFALRAGYWFVPTCLTILAVALSWVTVVADGILGQESLRGLAWMYTGGPEGARSILATIAGAVMGIAGVTFSITMVALTLASSQFGPRVLRSFLSDRGNQVVLGTFVATFMYCILVLRTVRNDDFVPHLSVTVAVTLALASLGVLIYFIHHTASAIQADSVIAAVARDLDTAIDRLVGGGVAAPGTAPAPGSAGAARGAGAQVGAGGEPVVAPATGYCQAVDHDALMRIAIEHDLVIRLRRRSGHFVVAGAELARVESRAGVDRAVTRGIAAAFIVGRQRTPEQDVEFAVNQLVEMALRALSPSINDPFTATVCIDWLGAALCRLAEAPPPRPDHHDDAGVLRLVLDVPTFPDLVEAALNQIRQAGHRDLAVTLRLLETIGEVAARARPEADRAALWHQAVMLREGSDVTGLSGVDREAFEARFRAVARAVGRS